MFERYDTSSIDGSSLTFAQFHVHVTYFYDGWTRCRLRLCWPIYFARFYPEYVHELFQLYHPC